MALGAWEYEGTIGNGYSFAHATYGANPSEKQLVRDQITFLSFGRNILGALGVESPHGGAIWKESFLNKTCMSIVLI